VGFGLVRRLVGLGAEFGGAIVSVIARLINHRLQLCRPLLR
jgi:hypothetical protein